MNRSRDKGEHNDRLIQYTIRPQYRLVRHVFFISCLILILVETDTIAEQPANFMAKSGILLLLVVLFYTNMYALVPHLLLKQRYGTYALASLGLTLLVVACFAWGMNYLRAHFVVYYAKEYHELTQSRFITTLFAFVMASTGVKLFQRWVVDIQRINELEVRTRDAELSQLKKQINPHFLFNTLNNVNVLTQRDPEKASQVLIKLSDLLRYQLYDSSRERVLLTADIQFLHDFLTLEKIRRDTFDFRILTTGEISGIQVPPLLFITFAENAVKHSQDAELPSFVELFFSVEKENLLFICLNSKPQRSPAPNGAGGLGLVNVKRTLELLFPHSHSLTIKDLSTTFQVMLTITLPTAPVPGQTALILHTDELYNR